MDENEVREELENKYVEWCDENYLDCRPIPESNFLFNAMKVIREYSVVFDGDLECGLGMYLEHDFVNDVKLYMGVKDEIQSDV